MAELQDNIPPGWDCKLDSKTGKVYYINHFTKTTTWEDPRNRLRHHGTPLHISTSNTSEYIPLQHGSPDLKRYLVYPSQPSPIPAFQMPGQYSPKYIPLQDMRSGTHMSPLSVRTAKVQDSSFSIAPDTDEAVVKISSMFPTVSDTHIRLLLKKYHNREAVVISALQVEKHPIATPGPFATPPPSRNHAPVQMTPPPGLRAFSRTSSPTLRTASGTNSTYTGSPRVGDVQRTNSPRPHSSPKLKLRYMKSIFPQAEETIILDVLTSNENNIQKASDALKEMGFAKKDTAKIKMQEIALKAQEQKAKEEAEKTNNSPPPVPKIKTNEEKKAIKANLQEHYADIPDHVITMALESVQFDEDRAKQILQIMVQEDNKMKETNGKPADEVDVVSEALDSNFLTVPSAVSQSQSRQSLKSLLKEKPESISTPFSRIVDGQVLNVHYNTMNLSNTTGSNPNYVKGANEKLLLEDYVKWQGPNPNLHAGPDRSAVKGPNKSLLSAKNYSACGPNASLCKGPAFGLAKGSIFSQMKMALLSESRGQ